MPSIRGLSPTDPEPGPIRRRPQEGDETGEPAWVETTSAYIGRLQALLRRVGSALIGGSFTGNARGENAVDIQGARATAAQVASGARAIAVGANNECSGEDAITLGASCRAVAIRAIAIGSGAHAEDVGALAVGQDAHASGSYGTAVGPLAGAGTAILATHALAAGDHAHAGSEQSAAVGTYAHALADRATALGPHARARLANTAVLSGLIATRRSDLAQDAHEDALSLGYLPLLHGAGALVTLTSDEIDLAAASTVAVSFPAGSRFMVRDLTLMVSAVAGLVSQPLIEAGTAADHDAHLSATATTALTAAGALNRFHLSAWATAVTDLYFGVTFPGAAAAYRGRVTWTGQLVEDEP